MQIGSLVVKLPPRHNRCDVTVLVVTLERLHRGDRLCGDFLLLLTSSLHRRHHDCHANRAFVT